MNMETGRARSHALIADAEAGFIAGSLPEWNPDYCRYGGRILPRCGNRIIAV